MNSLTTSRDCLASLTLVSTWRSLLALSLVLSAVHSSAAGLCNADEETYFSCRLRGSKQHISLCGAPELVGEDLRLAAKGWLQYRFGEPGKQAFVYPRRKENSLAKFSSDYQAHKTTQLQIFWYDLFFEDGARSYRLGVGLGDQGGHYGIEWHEQKTIRGLTCDGLDAAHYIREGDGNSGFARLVQALKARG